MFSSWTFISFTSGDLALKQIWAPKWGTMLFSYKKAKLESGNEKYAQTNNLSSFRASWSSVVLPARSLGGWVAGCPYQPEHHNILMPLGWELAPICCPWGTGEPAWLALQSSGWTKPGPLCFPRAGLWCLPFGSCCCSLLPLLGEAKCFNPAA